MKLTRNYFKMEFLEPSFPEEAKLLWTRETIKVSLGLNGGIRQKNDRYNIWIF